MIAPKKVTCPECKRKLLVEDRAHEGVRVVVAGTTPPGVCCQKAVTENYARVGVFITGGG